MSGDGLPTPCAGACSKASKWLSVPLNVQANNLFVLEENGAVRVQIVGWRRTAADVQQLRPEQWSPNAALRPATRVCAPKCGIRGRSVRSGVRSCWQKRFGTTALPTRPCWCGMAPSFITRIPYWQPSVWLDAATTGVDR